MSAVRCAASAERHSLRSTGFQESVCPFGFRLVFQFQRSLGWCSAGTYVTYVATYAFAKPFSEVWASSVLCALYLWEPRALSACTPGGHEVVQVACGKFHSLAVTRGGEVWAWGSATCGALGIADVSGLPHEKEDDSEVYQPVPTVVAGLQGHEVVQVAVSLPQPGGDARRGGVGVGRRDVWPGHEVVQVACGEDHSLAVTRGGEVWAWGSATCGRLGIADVSGLPREGEDDSEVYQPVPTVVAGLQGHEVVQVAVGACHSLAVTRGGEVWAWGSARHGALGIADFSWLPKVLEEGDLTPYNLTPTAVPGMPSVEFHTIAVSASGNHSAALLMPRYTAQVDTSSADASVDNTLLQMLHDPTFADVEFVVTTPATGKVPTAATVLAHKAVLCTRSEYFRRQFTGGLCEAAPGHGERTRVDVTDIAPATFRSVLHWIYAGKLPPELGDCNGEASLPAMLQAADKLQLQLLKMEVQERLVVNLTPKNAGSMWQLARQYMAAALEASAFAYMVQHIEKVQGFDDFHTVCESEPQLAKKLLSAMISPEKRSTCRKRGREQP
ncbi:hypothetical protein CYMTET_45269 [Cymbomonas tetramitiformis]|uniref:BTB domain-containing protein n=1 Tax=Cymbomonas tetramitiformis TaxID=36881 RepID=A0AAE0BYJ1_9CHLO|nr:hypothetical protein CYMTET_45269 [Cymbomonas tetramitiformis]